MLVFPTVGRSGAIADPGRSRSFHRPSHGWDVFTALTLADLRQTRDFTPIGILKWSLEPLSYMVVYFLLIGIVFNRAQFAFPVFLLCALVPWRYFVGVFGRSMSIVLSNSPIVATRVFPRVILPLVPLAAEGATFLVALSLVLPIMLTYGIYPTMAFLWLPFVIAVLVLLTSGPAYIAAVFGLYFPDYRGAVLSFFRLGFFVSAGLIPLNEVPGGLATLLHVNPMSGIFESFRAILLHGQTPRIMDITYPAAIGFALLSMGLALYRRYERDFPKRI